MLLIRDEQVAVFEEAALREFETRAVRHIADILPWELSDEGLEALTLLIGSGIRRAMKYGFEQEYDLLRWINLMFLLDEDFDTHPEFAWTTEFLNDTSLLPSARMDLLYEVAESLISREERTIGTQEPEPE